MNDVDELIRVLPQPEDATAAVPAAARNASDAVQTARGEPVLKSFLRTHLTDAESDIGGIELKHFFYGSHPVRNRVPRDSLMLDYVYRERRPLFTKRQGCIIGPMNVDYYTVHIVSDGGRVVKTADPRREIHLAHYKGTPGTCMTSRGNFTVVKAGENDVEMDESLRDEYRDRVVREMERMDEAKSK